MSPVISKGERPQPHTEGDYQQKPEPRLFLRGLPPRPRSSGKRNKTKTTVFFPGGFAPGPARAGKETKPKPLFSFQGASPPAPTVMVRAPLHGGSGGTIAPQRGFRGQRPLPEFRGSAPGWDSGAAPRAGLTYFTRTRSRSSRASAIWTALRAAPLRRLSATIHMLSPQSMVSSSRMRPTKTSSSPVTSTGMG